MRMQGGPSGKYPGEVISDFRWLKKMQLVKGPEAGPNAE